jgi:hypothetical protein
MTVTFVLCDGKKDGLDFASGALQSWRKETTLPH